MFLAKGGHKQRQGHEAEGERAAEEREEAAFYLQQLVSEPAEKQQEPLIGREADGEDQMFRVNIDRQQRVEDNAGDQQIGDHIGDALDRHFLEVMCPLQDVAEGDQEQDRYNVIKQIIQKQLLQRVKNIDCYSPLVEA